MIDRMSEIQQFYARKNIFITGGTGFLGKVLIEKLLRSCPNVGTIYILVRAKRGKNSQERLEELLANTVFDGVRQKIPNFARKIVGLSGDIAAKRLGLSVADQKLVINEVSVIFHVAATVRFNENLISAIGINVNSVKEIIEISKACKKFSAGVYVSTAYSNSVKSHIDETLYPPPFNYTEINAIMDLAKKIARNGNALEKFTESIIGDWPNTYTFTKAIAEGVIAEYANDIPFAIFRPSIVMAALQEPFVGWLDNTMALNGVITGVAIGIAHVLLVDGNLSVDIVPVDMACNGLLACAWETASAAPKKVRENIPVYNYVSTPENQITWNRVLQLNTADGNNRQFASAMYYCSVVFTKSIRTYLFLEFVLHFIPALLIDSVGKLIGKKTGLRELYLKIRSSSLSFGFFTLNEWNFENKKIQKLWESLNSADKETFPFSMKQLDWKVHAKAQLRGTRIFVLGEKEDNTDEARRRQFLLWIIHSSICFLCASGILWIIWKLFHW